MGLTLPSDRIFKNFFPVTYEEGKNAIKNRGRCAHFETVGGSIRPIFALFELKIAVN